MKIAKTVKIKIRANETFLFVEMNVLAFVVLLSDSDLRFSF